MPPMLFDILKTCNDAFVRRIMVAPEMVRGCRIVHGMIHADVCDYIVDHTSFSDSCDGDQTCGIDDTKGTNATHGCNTFACFKCPVIGQWCNDDINRKESETAVDSKNVMKNNAHVKSMLSCDIVCLNGFCHKTREGNSEYCCDACKKANVDDLFVETDSAGRHSVPNWSFI